MSYFFHTFEVQENVQKEVNKAVGTNHKSYAIGHGLRMPGEEITFIARLKIKSQSQMYRYDRSIFCLPHRPKFQISLIYAFIGYPYSVLSSVGRDYIC